MKVFGARCIVKEEKLDEKTGAGIIIPGRDKQSTNIGLVIDVGDGALLEDGTKVPMDIHVGDTVLYASFAGQPIMMKGQTVIILNERDILCKLDPSDN